MSETINFKKALDIAAVVGNVLSWERTWVETGFIQYVVTKILRITKSERLGLDGEN